ncbi:hypothetical protein IH980_03685 [Patescibacteria group bacterium]|nr:hypothetical protein [Patescibacteria group bacterium]
MKKKVLRILLLLLVIGALGLRLRSQGEVLGRRVEAVGHLTITYPGGPPGPVFDVSGMLPGDCETRTVDVENSGVADADVSVRSDAEVESDSLSTKLSMVIREGIADLYGGTSPTGPKKLSDFFADSDAVDGVPLSTVAGSGGMTSYVFEMCFDEEAGNELQGESVMFDLVFGEIIPPVELPDVCEALEGTVTEKIEGTPGDDDIKGTSASELILGFGGNDKIKGGGGDDCIIGGEGDDNIKGGSGNDIISGDAGEDNIKGGSGDDVIHGGDDNDEINAGSGNDIVTGGLGDDRLRGGAGIDVISGGGGNDRIWGGSGEDTLLGNADDDRIRGGSGSDFLDGGPGTDNLNGNSGIDTCVAGEALTSCEL